MDGRKSWTIHFKELADDGLQMQYVDPNEAVDRVAEIESLCCDVDQVVDELGFPVYQHGEWDETCLPGFPELAAIKAKEHGSKMVDNRP
ncbi:MAG: hypothetical protein HQL69_19410 [Magnetococcales bacterium]|nr:hypothetical protein [Magnetococcales bacterium]